MENGSSPGNNHGPRPKSMAVVDNGWESQGTNLVHAAYAYLSSGDNQLSFHEGDTIAISGKSTASKIKYAYFKFFFFLSNTNFVSWTFARNSLQLAWKCFAFKIVNALIGEPTWYSCSFLFYEITSKSISKLSTYYNFLVRSHGFPVCNANSKKIFQNPKIDSFWFPSLVKQYSTRQHTQKWP